MIKALIRKNDETLLKDIPYQRVSINESLLAIGIQNPYEDIERRNFMSATVAAALKKIAVAILTNPKILKTVLGIVLGIIIIIIMPIVAVIAIFNGDINIDTDRLQQEVVAQMSVEEQAKLQFVEDTMNGIKTAMTDAGYSAARVKEAQILYAVSLSEYAHDEGFVDKLVGCFASEQTDEQLITSVNTAFGTQLTTTDFTDVMSNIREE